MNLKIKICGLKDLKNIQEVEKLEIADYMGFIFYKNSKRYVGDDFKVPAVNSKKVGIFVGEDIHKVVKIVNNNALYQFI